MLGTMALYRLQEPVTLGTPVLVAAFDSWVDAGAAGTTAAGSLADDSRIVATFDADQLFDYRARRPTLDVVGGSLHELTWPELHLRAARIGERDILILSGPEPDFRWRQLAAEVTELVLRLNVESWVSLGAIPAAVPHTRPVPVLGTATAKGLLPDGVPQGPEGRLRVPSAAVSVLEHAVSRAGIPAIGLFAQVPHYISAAYPGAAIELLKHLGAYLKLDLPLGELPVKALETRNLLDAATTADERTKAYVERLETLADEARLPAGDELIADIERFLRDRGADGGNGDEGGGRLH
jgi:hypothetical protein